MAVELTIAAHHVSTGPRSLRRACGARTRLGHAVLRGMSPKGDKPKSCRRMRSWAGGQRYLENDVL
jgi:hypothetical protein